eukprot:1179564-Prorocentrum_minimum.AAC.6
MMVLPVEGFQNQRGVRLASGVIGEATQPVYPPQDEPAERHRAPSGLVVAPVLPSIGVARCGLCGDLSSFNDINKRAVASRT